MLHAYSHTESPNQVPVNCGLYLILSLSLGVLDQLWYQLAMRELPAGVPGNWLDPWLRVEKRQCQRNRGVQPRETM